MTRNDDYCTAPDPATQADQHVQRAKLNMLVLASKDDLSVWDRHVLETEIERDLQIAAVYSRLAVAQADQRHVPSVEAGVEFTSGGHYPDSEQFTQLVREHLDQLPLGRHRAETLA